MRFLKGLAVAAALLFGLAAPAFAADDYTVKDSAGTTITIRALDCNSGKKCTTHTVANSSGTMIDPATSGLQTTANTSLSTIATNTTGAATAANQSTGNTSLATIATNTTGVATAANQTSGNSSLSTIATAVQAATPAGENHTGETGSNLLPVTVAQTVTASSAYTSGNAVGGLMTVASAVRVSGALGAGGTSGFVQGVTINAKSAQSSLVDIFLFKANPTGSTCTDKTAFALATADFDKVLGVVHVTDWTSGGTASAGQVFGLAMPYALSSATTMYACAITRATPTFTATTDISVTFNLLRN
jgi:hypothetical protein